MAGGLHEGNEYRADVATVASYQHSHPDVSRSSHDSHVPVSSHAAAGVLTVGR